MTDNGRAPSGQALVASDGAATHLHPTGFDPSRLRELADRCEKATGPDRRLDVQIEIAINPTKPWIVGEKPGRWPRDPVYGTLTDFWSWAIDDSKEPPEINAARYTASLDAAMTLVPEEWRFAGSESMAGGFYTHLITRELVADGAKAHTEAHADSLALAISAAALRAHAAIAMETQRAETENAGSVAKP